MHTSVSRFALLAAAVLLFPHASSAASIPVDVTILQGETAAPAVSKQVERREVMFLVLDHSGSMNETDGRDSSRWQALLDSLASTLKSVRVGTEVRVEWIESSWEKDRRGRLVKDRRGNPVRKALRRTKPVVLSGPESWKSVWEDVKAAGDPDETNGTPLFETLESVCNSARALVRKGTRVAVVVFSDGNSNEPDKDDRRGNIDREFLPLFSDNRFKTCLVWINPADNPSTESLLGSTWNLGYKAPPAIYSTSAEPAAISVANPLSGGTGRGSLSYAFHVPADVWKAMEGKPAQISLVRRTEGGATESLGAATLEIRRGTQGVSLAVPDGRLGGSGLSLRLSNIPSPEGAVVSPPPPVELLLVEPDRLSLSSVSPADGTVVREGDEIAFSVVATPDASVEWTFGDGLSAKGGKAVHAYRNAGTYDAKVLVRKDGFAPREGLSETRRIEVVRASVALAPFEPPVVGREVSFSCKGVGPVTGYTWIVDGGEVAGTDSPKKDSSALHHAFQTSGRHSVQIRADLDRLGYVLSEKKEFTVAAAPFLRIDEPVSGQTFDADAPISFRASAEGGVSEVVWRVSDATGAEVKVLPAPVAGNAAGAEASLPAAGEYVVRVADKTGAATSTEVFFSVRPKDLALSVSEPADGTRVETGANVTFKASAKGVSEVLWFVRDEDAGRETPLGKSQVGADGYASKAHTFPPEEGSGSRTVLVRDASGAIEAEPVRIELFTEGDVKIVEPADYLRVPFGSNVTLRAEATGAAGDVRWFVDGAELPAKGDAVSFAPARSGGPERLFRVQARASMPGGGSRITPERTIVGYCPALEPRVDLAKKDWDVGAPVQLKVVSPAGRIGKVFWSFGDGTPEKGGGAVESHAFAKDGSYAVSARAVCADCGESFAAAPVRVAIRCPALSPVLTIRRESADDDGDVFSRGKPVSMSLGYADPGSSARCGERVWDFGDGTTATNLDETSHAFVDYGDRTVSVSVRCSACGRVETASKTIRIDLKPPKAHFKICRTTSSDKPAGGWIGQGGSVALVSTSTGDVAGLRWSRDGEPLSEFDDNPAPEVDCTDVGKHVFSLVVLDPAGLPSEPESHSIRVYRLWAILLLLFAAAALSGWFWYYFAGDDPRFWTLTSLATDDCSLNEQSAQSAMPPGRGTPVSRFWRTRDNRAVIHMSDLGGRQSPDDWGKNTDNGKAELCLSESKVARSAGDKSDRQPQAKLQGSVPPGMSLRPHLKGHLLQISAPSPVRPDAMAQLWVRINTSKKHANGSYLWFRIGLTILFFGIAAALVRAFAA